MKDRISSALYDSRTSFVFVIAYTGLQQLAEPVELDIKDFLNDLNNPEEVASIKIFSQKEVYNAITGKVEGDPINIEVILKDWGYVEDPFSAYYGQIEAEDVASWFNKYNTRLFTRNLRNYKGNTEVNESIRKTLIETPEKFWYFNNGITLLCTRISKKPLGGSDRKIGFFECEGVSVVNGAQTVGSIGTAYAIRPEMVKRARVLVKFISLENCPQDFDTEVTKAANTQNRIEKRDFASLDPEQQRLKEELWFDGKAYSYRTGDPKPPHDKGCDIEDATIALACMHSDLSLAVQAKREISKLWEDIEKPPYKLLFNSGLSGRRLWRAVEILYVVEGILRSQQSILHGRDQLIAINGNRFILHHVFMALSLKEFDDENLDFEAVKKLANDATIPILNALIEQVNKNFAASYPANLFKNRTKCQQISQNIIGSDKFHQGLANM